MTSNPSALSVLFEIAKIDSNLAHIAAEELHSRKDLSAREEKLKKEKILYATKAKTLADKQYKYGKEERALRDEQSKLVDRRKALASFPNYKLQQAAEREIDATAKDLSTREEVLLGELDLLEVLEKEVKNLKEHIEKEEIELTEAAKEFAEMKTGYDERRTRQSARRGNLVNKVDATSYGQYAKVQDKYKVDPMAALDGNKCTGCYMQQGAQTLVILNKQSGLVRCPGCGRIVYLPDLISPVSDD